GVDVPGADDLVHAGDRLGAVGEGRHRLRSARVHQRGDARQVTGGAHLGARIGAGEVDRLDAGDRRGDGGHEDARGVTGLAARSVDAHSREGGDAARQRDAVLLVLEAALLVRLPLVVVADARGGRLEGSPELRREGGEGSGPAVVVHDELGDVAVLEARDVAPHCGVTLVAHLPQDLSHRGLDAIQVRLATPAQLLEEPLEAARPFELDGERVGLHVPCPPFTAAGSYSRSLGPSASRKASSSSMSMSTSAKPPATCMLTARIRRNMAKLDAQSRGCHVSVPLIAVYAGQSPSASASATSRK